jgi:hypothetical protein
MIASLRYGVFVAALVGGFSIPGAPAWSAGGGGGGGGGGGPGPSMQGSQPAEELSQPRATPEQSPTAPRRPEGNQSRRDHEENPSQPGAGTNR